MGKKASGLNYYTILIWAFFVESWKKSKSNMDNISSCTTFSSPLVVAVLISVEADLQ
jgi:hypothetical protein